MDTASQNTSKPLSKEEKERQWRLNKKKIKKDKQKTKSKAQKLRDEQEAARREKEELARLLDARIGGSALGDDSTAQNDSQEGDGAQTRVAGGGGGGDTDHAEQNQNDQTNQDEQQQDQQQQDQDEEAETEIEQILTGRYYEDFKDVFANFRQNADKALVKINERAEDEDKQAEEERQAQALAEKRARKEKLRQEKIEREAHISRKKKKQMRWLKVAELKAKVERPELVEAWDITAPDPLTLVYTKSLRNTVPVPKHWAQKRRFLAGRRGFEKTPFKLPEYIERTGISKLRDPFVNRGGAALVRQKLRERMNPKLGKIDIDYEVLHDAFFKYQTKPKLTTHGEVYFEGKEEEYKSREFRPGRMSADLRAALGITDYAPPPWLVNMQRFGPPPSFPFLRIKTFANYTEASAGGGGGAVGAGGIGAGGAVGAGGAPPNAGQGQNLLQQPGVYATFKAQDDDGDDLEEIAEFDKGFWGEPMEEEEDEEEEDQQQGAGGDGEDKKAGSESGDSDDKNPLEDLDFGETVEKYKTQRETVERRSGISSVVDGLETPEVDLRKIGQGARDDGDQPLRPLYQTLEQVNVEKKKGQLFGGHTYVIPENKKQ